MLFRLASDTEDNDEALGKHIWPFLFCPLLPPSYFREPVLGSCQSVWGVACCRLVSLWLGTNHEHVAAIGSVTGFLHFTVSCPAVSVYPVQEQL